MFFWESLGPYLIFPRGVGSIRELIFLRSLGVLFCGEVDSERAAGRAV